MLCCFQVLRIPCLTCPEIQNLSLASIHSEALSMPTSSYSAGKEGTSEAGSVDPGKAEILFM